MRAHNLAIIETLLVSTPRLVANEAAWADEWKRRKIENLALMLVGAIQAGDLVGLKMNVRKTDLEKVTSILPALQNPTLSALADDEWMAVETILSDRQVRELIPELVRAGARGIVEYPLYKVIP